MNPIDEYDGWIRASRLNDSERPVVWKHIRINHPEWAEQLRNDPKLAEMRDTMGGIVFFPRDIVEAALKRKV